MRSVINPELRIIVITNSGVIICLLAFLFILFITNGGYHIADLHR